MKKVMFVLAVAGMFAFAACNNGAEQNADSIDSTAAVVEEAPVEEVVDTNAVATEEAPVEEAAATEEAAK